MRVVLHEHRISRTPQTPTRVNHFMLIPFNRIWAWIETFRTWVCACFAYTKFVAISIAPFRVWVNIITAVRTTKKTIHNFLKDRRHTRNQFHDRCLLRIQDDRISLVHHILGLVRFFRSKSSPCLYPLYEICHSNYPSEPRCEDYSKYRSNFCG
jgi:hypothetical protein